MNFGKVKAAEWVAGLCGVLILVAMFQPWYGEEAAFSSVGAVDVILVLAGLGGALLPVVVARSRYTNVPIVTVTMVSDLATIALVVLLVKLVWPPSGGLKTGFFLGLAGAALLAISGWKSAARES
ncbi:MAG: hypothetical protein M3Y23_02495 [Actinomycetota bacterium]|nr:hypothetical protein [Actinomycetota bacterium]